jgi:hypothetical protein
METWKTIGIIIFLAGVILPLGVFYFLVVTGRAGKK